MFETSASTDSVIYPVAAVPLVLAIITWVVIIARRKKVASVGIVAVIGAFLILVITFLTCLAVIVATVLQFLNNLRYLR